MVNEGFKHNEQKLKSSIIPKMNVFTNFVPKIGRKNIFLVLSFCCVYCTSLSHRVHDGKLSLGRHLSPEFNVERRNISRWLNFITLPGTTPTLVIPLSQPRRPCTVTPPPLSPSQQNKSNIFISGFSHLLPASLLQCRQYKNSSQCDSCKIY